MFKKYDNYKDSGLEWLGEIPSEWGVKRVKDNFYQISERSNKLDKNTYIPLENIESFSGKLLKRISNENNEDSLLFKKDDILFNKLRPYLAKVLLAEFNGGVSQEVIVMRVNKLLKNNVFPKYFLFRFLSESFIAKSNSMTDGVKMPRANPYKIMNLHFALPSLKTQTKIATYLDTQTQKIDKEIQLLEEKSLKYKELKQTLINETVLRGLDKGVKLKDSGIEWIGDIPEGWGVKRLKDISKIKTGYTPSKEINNNYSKDGFIWIKPDELNNLIPVNNSKEKVSFIGLKKQNIIPRNSVLVCCIGSIGKFGIAGTDVITNQQINSIIFNKNIIPSFGKYIIASSKKEHLRLANGNVVKILNSTNQGRIIFTVPPLKEQTKIAIYLDEKTQKIDAITKTITTKITLLKEFRKTLINDVVTGKVKI